MPIKKLEKVNLSSCLGKCCLLLYFNFEISGNSNDCKRRVIFQFVKNSFESGATATFVCTLSVGLFSFIFDRNQPKG